MSAAATAAAQIFAFFDCAEAADFGIAAEHRGIADHMDTGLQRRFECCGITGHHRVRSVTPAASAIAPAFCGGITLATSAFIVPKSVTKLFRLRVDRNDIAACREANPFEKPRIEPAPRRLELRCMRERYPWRRESMTFDFGFSRLADNTRSSLARS